MNQWGGKARGTLLGYKIFIFFIKKVGIRSAYFVLYFVALYYFLFLWKSNKAIYYYFRKRLKYGLIKSMISVYRSYFTFGQTLIDKIAISSGLRGKFTYEFDGIEILKKVLSDKKGGIFISAHMGNFEIAPKFFADIDINLQINVVSAYKAPNIIEEYLSTIKSDRSTEKIIFIKDDLSHVFEMNNALSDNELICFTGDRYYEGSKTLETELLGKKAKFPMGTFLIASRLKVPVVFVYVMKESNLHYHLYAREATVKHRDAQALLQSYTQSVETMIEKYPLQWFNYFDFWKD